MTQIALALKKAGYETTWEKLRRFAHDVLAVYPEPRSTAAAEALMARVRSDADLLYELFKSHREVALRSCLMRANDELREEGRRQAAEERQPKALGGGHNAYEGQALRAPAARPGGDGGHMSAGTQVGVAAAPLLTPAAVALAKLNVRREADRAVAKVLVLSRLDTFQIDGVPLGKTNFGHVRRWARARGQESRWLVMLAANYPPEFIVDEYVTPERAEACWRQMLEEGAAA
jgi:hypothetical protein